MKAGDKFPVTIAGETIAEASVKEVSEANSTVTLVVPATLVTMSYRTHDELTPNDPAQEVPEAEGTEHILLTDRVEQPVKPVEQDLATQQVPGETPSAPPAQPETVPTETQTPAVPVTPVPEEEQTA